ncbi:hypothetical protein K3495_g2545 [Podosphaera aphanis]|nr:hypothetical protein K3495_g2545 [Podosphaera aphanis]
MRPMILFTSYLLLLAPGILGHQLVPRREEEKTASPPPIVIDGRPVKEFDCGSKTYLVAKYQHHIFNACQRKPSNLWRGPKRFRAPSGKYSIRGPYFSIPLDHETLAPHDKSRPLDLVIVTRRCLILGMVTPRRRNIASKSVHAWAKGVATPTKYDYDKCENLEIPVHELSAEQYHDYYMHRMPAETVKQGKQQKAEKSRSWWSRKKEPVAA